MLEISVLLALALLFQVINLFDYYFEKPRLYLGFFINYRSLNNNMKKSKDNILIFIYFLLIALIIYFFSFPSKLPYDPLWNFQSIYKITNYGSIYTVNNVIHTPLYFEIGKVFFKILGSNFVTYSFLQFTPIFTIRFKCKYLLYLTFFH